MKRAAVILSGCGVFDGAEIHESVLSLLALDKAGASYQCFAPDVEQAHVVNHLTGEEMEESRNVLVEAARIARGKVKPLSEAKVEDFDLVMLPGGFGAAKNLCNFAFDAENLEALPELVEFLKSAHGKGLPIGFACIAPAIAARAFGSEGLAFTIGDDAGTAEALSKWGAAHQDRSVTEIVVDEKLKIVTTPAYMFGEARISDVASGLESWVKATLALS
ncbi:isoprenoid biosynthesis glyoxalase ElbB [Pelagicoccus sp. SDUM812003]|uniref:isoprenoid biosynthesis glyoxalase ElbB n=1 Tax=Pelagicoccus sp. SDUM812003 TaxID=3041267 RepID=UPI00280D8F13|nr:isoprenoid biosynthesis glyoxalase ElbB [Pelagicoccus sp. SDUM812003]MDQ8202342.1 isoprenoid biosynthesis glyoxalase ElbB [Pelagicoccus sp. SDUM812003]